MSKKGFTFIELLVVLSIIGTLANLALPPLQRAKTRAKAATIVADIAIVRQAAVTYFAAQDEFPSSGGWGQVPPEMANDLPHNFSFERHGMTYRWKVRNSGPSNNGRGRGRATNQPQGTAVATVDVRTDDGDLLAAVRGLWQNSTWSGNNRQATLIIQ